MFAFICLAMAPGRAAAQTAVPTAVLRPAIWRTSIQLSASLDAQQDAILGAPQGGRVVAVLYHSGQDVAAGTLLVQLDDGPQAAQLLLDQTRLGQAGRALARQQKLMMIAGSSQAALEQAAADQAEARAQVALDQANLAQLQVVAPFAGTMGIRRLAAGDYVQQGTAVASITQTAPLRVLFAVPQTEAGGLAVGDGFSLAAASLPGSDITTTGQITALSPMVDAATNARQGEGVVSQPPAGLLPGMYGTITLQTGTPIPSFLCPSTALNDSVLGRYVFVLQPSGKVFVLHTVYVTQYGQLGDDTVIATNGLAAGDRVVSIGGFKLQDGASVTLESP